MVIGVFLGIFCEGKWRVGVRKNERVSWSFFFFFFCDLSIVCMGLYGNGKEVLGGN